eukprot:COSAG05_NODE_168_length_15164_cov_8.323734_2_plen_102_part_00
MGTLIAAGQGINASTKKVHLLMTRSENGGKNWSAPSNLLGYEWTQDIENPMLGADSTTGKVFCFFTTIERHPGGCDDGILTESGFQMIVSTDRGKHRSAQT